MVKTCWLVLMLNGKYSKKCFSNFLVEEVWKKCSEVADVFDIGTTRLTSKEIDLHNEHIEMSARESFKAFGWAAHQQRGTTS